MLPTLESVSKAAASTSRCGAGAPTSGMGLCSAFFRKFTRERWFLEPLLAGEGNGPCSLAEFTGTRQQGRREHAGRRNDLGGF